MCVMQLLCEYSEIATILNEFQSKKNLICCRLFTASKQNLPIRKFYVLVGLLI